MLASTNLGTPIGGSGGLLAVSFGVVRIDRYST
jgi:hypothetical protein